MYVCLCLGVTDRDIRQAVADGAQSVKEVNSILGTAKQCGKCGMMTRDIVKNELASGETQSLFYKAS